MTTKKVLFFTAGPVATAAEKTAIEKLNAIAEAPYSVYSRNAIGNFNYGAGKESADYVAGTIPSAYSAVPVIDPDNPPAPTLPANQAIVTSGDTVSGVTGTGTTATITVTDGVITIALS